MGSEITHQHVRHEDKTQKLAENLRALLKSRNLTVSQLAQILDMPMMTVRRLVSGETSDPRISTLKLLADYFEITVDCLIEGSTHSQAKSAKKSKQHLVPKIEWETAKRINSVEDLDLDTWVEWQSISLGQDESIGKNAFAIESRPSMHPRFPQGTILVIDPEVTPTDGDIVLVKLRENNELTLRELVVDPPERKLYPVVAGSNILEYSEKDQEIIGVNVLTMLFSHKVSG